MNLVYFLFPIVLIPCISVDKGQIDIKRRVIKCNQHDYLLCYRDELYSYMFRPLSGHSQAIKTYKSKITIAASVMGDQLKISAFGVTIHMGIQNVKPKQYMTQNWDEYSGYRNTTCHFLFSLL